LAESLLEDCLTLGVVLLGIASSCGGRDVSSNISRLVVRAANSFEKIPNAGLHEGPSTLVLGLILYPLHLSIGVTRELGLELAEREGAELLDAYDSDVVDTALGPLVVEIVVELAAAKQNFAYLEISDRLWVSVLEDVLESKAFAELFDCRISTTVLEELLALGNNERLAEGSPDLASQHVEELCSGRALNESEVHAFSNLTFSEIIGRVRIRGITQRQEALDTAGRVLRSSAIIAVRQKHDQARFDIPFGLTRSHELIDHNLGAVCKVAKLGLPEDKSVGVSLGVALLKAKHCVF